MVRSIDRKTGLSSAARTFIVPQTRPTELNPITTIAPLLIRDGPRTERRSDKAALGNTVGATSGSAATGAGTSGNCVWSGAPGFYIAGGETRSGRRLVLVRRLTWLFCCTPNCPCLQRV